MTTRHPDPEELMASLDEEVAADRVREIWRHLETCAACAALVDQLRASTAALAGWSVDAPQAALSARVREAAQRPRESRSPASWHAGRVRWAVLAALIILGVAVPLRMECVEASPMCAIDRMGQLLRTARPPDADTTAGKEAGVPASMPVLRGR